MGVLGYSPTITAGLPGLSFQFLVVYFIFLFFLEF